MIDTVAGPGICRRECFACSLLRAAAGFATYADVDVDSNRRFNNCYIISHLAFAFIAGTALALADVLACAALFRI